MAGITGQSTTFGLPNYPGELIGLTPEDTPFLAMAGGLSGGETTDSTHFGWSTYDLRTASQPEVLEGAAAPTAEARVRAFASNVVQIHHETIETSYTKMAATGQLADVGSNHPYITGYGGVQNNVMSEHDWQVEQMVKQIARDVEYSFINGSFQEPANNSTARKTRGILEAVSTNSTTKWSSQVTGATATASGNTIDKTSHGLSAGDQIAFTTLTGGAGLSLKQYETYFVAGTVNANDFQVSLTKGGSVVSITSNYTDVEFDVLAEPTADDVLTLFQDIWDNGGIQETETRTVFVNSGLKRYLTKLFVTDQGYQEGSRNVGGVNVTTVETDFGRFNIVLERHMPKSDLLVASMEQVAPVFLLVPGKGVLFREPIGLTGSAKKEQLYGEIGLKYGSELSHGKIVGFHGKYDPA